MATLLLFIGENRKKVMIDIEHPTLMELKSFLIQKDSFTDLVNIPRSTFQIFDEEFNDFIDLQEGDLIENKSKIKVIDNHNDIQDHGQQNKDNVQPDSLIVSSPNEESIKLGPEQNLTAMTGKLKEPVTFKLPAFSTDIATILKDLEQPTPKQRRHIVDCLCQYMMTCTMYPSRRFYTIVGSTLVGVYPHLKDVLGSGYDSWVALIRIKFKNTRRSMNTEEVMSKRAIFGKQSKPTVTTAVNPVTSPKIMRMNVKGSDVSLGEDRRSITMHIKWLQKGSQKRKPDEVQVSDRMRITFQDRQIMLQTKSVQECLDCYPFLMREEQILKDFEAIVGKDLDKQLLSMVNKFAATILKRLSTVDKREWIETLRQDTSLDGDSKKYRLAIATVDVIVSHFKEDLGHLVSNEDDTLVVTPVLRYEGESLEEATTIALYVEKIRLLEVPDFLIGLECLFATYWLFNIQYSPKVFNTLTLFEILFFGLSYTKPRPPVLRTINTIHNVKY